MKAFICGVLALILLGVFQLWPSKDGLWLVQLSPFGTGDQVIAQLYGMPVDLVDIVDQRSFLIKPHNGVSPATLIRLGAVLVIEAPLSFGCDSSNKSIAWQAKVNS